MIRCSTIDKADRYNTSPLHHHTQGNDTAPDGTQIQYITRILGMWDRGECHEEGGGRLLTFRVDAICLLHDDHRDPNGSLEGQHGEKVSTETRPGKAEMKRRRRMKM